MNKAQMEEAIKSNFEGRDPLNEINTRIQNMSVKDLRSMVLISCNQIGTAIKQGEYEDVYDSALHLNLGADVLLQAYDVAVLTVTEGIGN